MCVLFLLTSPLLYPEAMLALVEGRREKGRERGEKGREGRREEVPGEKRKGRRDRGDRERGKGEEKVLDSIPSDYSSSLSSSYDKSMIILCNYFLPLQAIAAVS